MRGKTTDATPDRSPIVEERPTVKPELVDGPPAFVTVGDAARLAEQVRQALTAREELIEKLRYPHPETRRRTRGARTVSPDFIQAMVEIVERFPMLENVGPLKPSQAQERMEFIDAFRPILRQAQTFTDALSYTLESVHAELAEEALQVYRIASALARNEANAELAARLEVPTKILGRKGGKKPRAKVPAK